VNPKAFGGFQNGQSFALAEGNGLCLLLGRESAALSGHGVHSRLGRRLSDLSIESGQPHIMKYYDHPKWPCEDDHCYAFIKHTCPRNAHFNNK
jgi:hypothetical protein